MKSFVSKVLLPLLGGSVTIAVAAGFLLGGRTLPPTTPVVADAPGTNSQTNPADSGTDADSELKKKEELSPKNPKDSPGKTSTQDIYLNLQSNPPGARAEVGLQFNGWQIVPGTGRLICTTPCTEKLNPADVAILPNGIANLVVRLEKANFAPHIDVIELGKLDRPLALKGVLEEGHNTYSRSITLQSNDWRLKDDQAAKDSKPESK